MPTRLRIALATSILPQAFALALALTTTAVLCLFLALGVATLAEDIGSDGLRGAMLLATLVSEALGCVLAIETTLDVGVRLGRALDRRLLRSIADL